jgi:hypothetical protein
MIVDGQEIAERYTEYGIRNKTTGEVLFSEANSFETAEFEAFLYPNAEVVSREIYVTSWKTADGPG